MPEQALVKARPSAESLPSGAHRERQGQGARARLTMEKDCESAQDNTGPHPPCGLRAHVLSGTLRVLLSCCFLHRRAIRAFTTLRRRVPRQPIVPPSTHMPPERRSPDRPSLATTGE
jgi:hypothetical protein